MPRTSNVRGLYKFLNQETQAMKKSATKKQKNLQKKKYEKPAFIHSTKIETLAGTCAQTVGQTCVPAFD